MRFFITVGLCILLLTSNAEAGRFQQMIYDSAKKVCTNSGFSPLQKEGWSTCMKALIDVKHDEALKIYGFSKPPAQTPSELADETCSKKSNLKTLKLKDKETCVRNFLPSFEERQREVWSQTSDLDK